MNYLFDIQTLTLIVTIVLGFTGYLITHRSEIARSKRSEQLALVNRQINDFYGPLYIIVKDSETSYATFLQKHRTFPPFFKENRAPTNEELTDWQIWVTSVFMPLNLHLERLILENAYLIREQEIPECILEFLAHVSSYKAVIGEWEKGVYSENLSINHYPAGLEQYAQSSYSDLKKQQLKLIGRMK